MLKFTVVVFGASLLASSMLTTLAAQSTTTIPQNLGGTEGRYFGFGPLRETPSRVQCGYSQGATGWQSPQVIRSLSARADSRAYLKSALSLELQVWLSSRGCNPGATGRSWASNHGVDKALFFRKKLVNFAPFNAALVTQPFNIVLKGDTIFVATTPSLLVDWASYAKTYQRNDNFLVDVERAAVRGWVGRKVPYGKGCNPVGFRCDAHNFNIHQNLQTWGRTGTAGDLVFSWISPKRSDIPIGGACSIYADFTAPGTIIHPIAFRTSDASGYASFYWGPTPPAMAKNKFYSQMLAFDSNGRHRFSTGIEIEIGDLEPVYLCGQTERYATSTKYFDPDVDELFGASLGYAIVFKVN